MRCLSEGDITDFVQHQLAPEAMRSAEAHIGQCELCRALVAEAVRSSSIPHVPAADLDESLQEVAVPAAAFALGPTVGQLLQGRFRIERVLGRGGMGVVYRAHDEKLDLPVALKVIVPQGKRAEELTRRLLRELRLTRSISHPNVCRVFDIGEDRGQMFFTMELLEGETLEARGWQKAISRDEVVPLLVQICRGLAAAHQQNIVHRDLKPGNIMVSQAGHVTIMDFGLAKDVSAVHITTQDAVGTPAYWPPEQARGEAVTTASDLFSFGLIAYRLFAGRMDAAFPTAADLACIPASYRSTIASCLELDREKRASSAAAIQNALERVDVSPEGKRTPRRKVFLAFGVVALAVVAGLGLLLSGERASERGDAGQGEGASASHSASGTAALASSPSENVLAFPTAAQTLGAVSATGTATGSRPPKRGAPAKSNAGRTVVPVVD